MKRKITELERKLINDGWCLALKRYSGKHSDKILCYEYHKTSDLRNNGKTYEQIIKLDQKRSQIVDYGIKNVVVDFLNDQELCLLRFLHLELKHFVERVSKREPRDAKPLFYNPFEPYKPYEPSENDWLKEREKYYKIEDILKEPKEKTCIKVCINNYDERQELPPMNDEQFDELCKEMENEQR